MLRPTSGKQRYWVGLLVAGALAVSVPACSPTKENTVTAAEENERPVIACTLTSEEQTDRIASVINPLFAKATAVRKSPDGYAARFSDEHIDDLIEFIEFERTCCSFMTYGLEFEPQKGPVWLIARGPNSTRGLTLALIGSGAVAGDSGWQADFDKATKKAQESDRPILVEFRKGDASNKLNKELFCTPTFRSWARKNVVLLELNYGKGRSKKLSAQYDDLKRKYEIEEFPTVLLLSHEGKLLGRPPAYRKGGVEAWIKETSELVSGSSNAGTWMTDFEEAKKHAKRMRKPMLLNFNGSDW